MLKALQFVILIEKLENLSRRPRKLETNAESESSFRMSGKEESKKTYRQLRRQMVWRDCVEERCRGRVWSDGVLLGD